MAILLSENVGWNGRENITAASKNHEKWHKEPTVVVVEVVVLVLAVALVLVLVLVLVVFGVHVRGVADAVDVVIFVCCLCCRYCC